MAKMRKFRGKRFKSDRFLYPTYISFPDTSEDQEWITFDDEIKQWVHAKYFVVGENLAPPDDFTHRYLLGESHWELLLFCYHTTPEEARQFFGIDDLDALSTKTPDELSQISQKEAS